MKRPPRAAIAAVVLIAALGVTGWYIYSQQQANGDEDAVSGTVDAEEVQISPLVGGRILEADLAEGDRIEAGQVLYQLDDRALQLQVDQAEAGVEAAKAAYRQAKDDEESAADVAAAKARWDQAVAARDIARVQLSWATLSSPTTGTVTSVTARTGETASPGRTLATILKDDSIFIRAFVPETQIGDVSIGQSAVLTTDGGDEVDATVVFIASQAQFTPSSVETKEQRAKLVYEVRLRPESAEGLNPGMPLTVSFDR